MVHTGGQQAEHSSCDYDCVLAPSSLCLFPVHTPLFSKNKLELAWIKLVGNITLYK